MGGLTEIGSEGHQRVGDRHQAGEGARRELSGVSGLPDDEEQRQSCEQEREETPGPGGGDHRRSPCWSVGHRGDGS